jgi:hypothetical protein
MQKFKIGDKVKYSNKIEHSAANIHLKFNEIYTVKEVHSGIGTSLPTLSVKEIDFPNFYWVENFTLVQSSEKQELIPLENVQKEINKIYSDISMVDHPQHYKGNKFEVIDIIHDYNLSFDLGNSVKYLLRAGKKDPTKTVEDCRKAIWYIESHIKQLEGK